MNNQNTNHPNPQVSTQPGQTIAELIKDMQLATHYPPVVKDVQGVEEQVKAVQSLIEHIVLNK